MDEFSVDKVLAQLAAGAIVGYCGARILLLLLDWWQGLMARRPALVDPVAAQVWDVLAAADQITREAANATD